MKVSFDWKQTSRIILGRWATVHTLVFTFSTFVASTCIRYTRTCRQNHCSVAIPCGALVYTFLSLRWYHILLHEHPWEFVKIHWYISLRWSSSSLDGAPVNVFPSPSKRACRLFCWMNMRVRSECCMDLASLLKLRWYWNCRSVPVASTIIVSGGEVQTDGSGVTLLRWSVETTGLSNLWVWKVPPAVWITCTACKRDGTAARCISQDSSSMKHSSPSQ